MRHLDTDNEGSMRGETLLQAIAEDKKVGKIPVYVSIHVLKNLLQIYVNLLMGLNRRNLRWIHQRYKPTNNNTVVFSFMWWNHMCWQRFLEMRKHQT